MAELKIRYRTGHNASLISKGLRADWREYQVVQGRRVLSRHDTEEQAQRWIDRRPAASVTPAEGVSHE